MKVLRRRAMLAKVQLCYATQWRMERAGKFPARIQLGPNSVGWIEAEIDEWIATRARGVITTANVNKERDSELTA